MGQLNPGMSGEFREDSVTDLGVAGELVDVCADEHEFCGLLIERSVSGSGLKGSVRSRLKHGTESNTGKSLGPLSRLSLF